MRMLKLNDRPTVAVHASSPVRPSWMVSEREYVARIKIMLPILALCFLTYILCQIIGCTEDEDAPAPPPHAAAAATAAAAPATDNTGLKKGELRRIPVVVYEAKPDGASAATTECAICLGEFDDGERVRVLPGCHHGFHVQCIDLWLAKHPSCPTCRNSLLMIQQGRHAGDGEATTVAAAAEET